MSGHSYIVVPKPEAGCDRIKVSLLGRVLIGNCVKVGPNLKRLVHEQPVYDHGTAPYWDEDQRSSETLVVEES